ncbi:hypothetical protein CS0771_50260 [Catellatospora sp. IY07-71]|uniref:hypothetical protein n=1 Tax=Catellatospora sp. IY07-71 TaxID=2728827 RepID=UPI001BB4146E|nr:hypothetical protein [Catellatospora sp. IY07-71]BCJ75482.1 hypothetical protein CS0771_50260 [Catellatospora sp. IY07-71]
MSWADMPPRNDVSRRARPADQRRTDFDGEFADLRLRARHLIAEIGRLSRQLTDLQKAIRARNGGAGGHRDGASATDQR